MSRLIRLLRQYPSLPWVPLVAGVVLALSHDPAMDAIAVWLWIFGLFLQILTAMPKLRKRLLQGRSGGPRHDGS
jgi:hypothetical protein